MSRQTPVYIFDKPEGVERWGVLLMDLKITDVTAYYELKTLHKHPLGFIFSEFISLDEQELINPPQPFCAEEDELLFSPYTMIESLSHILFCEEDTTECVYADLHSEIMYIANSIAVFREFIDLCNSNRAMFSDIWFDAFMRVCGGYDDFPAMEEYIKGPIKDSHKWERCTNIKSLNEIVESSIDFENPNPKRNAQKLCEILTHSVGEFIEDYIENPLVVFKYRHPIAYMSLSLENLIKENILPKKCKNCGKYFIPVNRSDTLYCDRQSPQDSQKSCKEHGARQAWQNTLRENEAAGLYRNIYMAKQMQAKRNPNIEIHKIAFEDYKTQAKQWKFDIKAGTKTEADYIEWLKAVKEKKVP